MADYGKWGSAQLGEQQVAAMAWDPRRNHKRFQIFFFIFSLFVFSRLKPLPSASAATLWSDASALYGLRQAWNATPGLLQNWTLGSDPCWNQWMGVSCFQNSVISLRLDKFGIIGTLSPAIGRMRNLLYLNIANNPGLTGAIPEEIGDLFRLYALDLSNCSLSGRIPGSLGNLGNASYIYLQGNQLSGELPYTIGYLSKLLELSLGRNNLNGSIPFSSPDGFPVGLNNLTSLLTLNLERNKLSGKLSPSLGQLQRLTTLLLRRNSFSGCLSCAISNEGLYGLDNLTELGQIDLSFNSFEGPIPDFLLKLPLIKILNLSANRFAGVLDGGLRASGRVDIYLVNNNISSIINFPSPFIDPKLGGNSVCQDQSFPFVDICTYVRCTHGSTSWQQRTSCTTVCEKDSVAHPTSCSCSYPYSCDMFFGWSKTFGLDGARIGHLTRRLASELNVLYGDVWIESATYKNISERELLAKVLFFPPSPKQRWDKAQITSLDDRLVNKTIKLLGYDPYGLISSNLRTLTNPLSSGSADPITKQQPNHNSLPIVTGVIGGFVGLVTLISLLICFVKRRRIPSPLDNHEEIFDHLSPDHFPSCLFSYDELKASTRNFHRGNKIGEGTFGAVYKGTMRDGSEVAVKELPSNIKQDNQAFLNEVELISGFQHKNLVKLRGCGIRNNSRLLVYEYVENNCLAQALFGSKAILLEWPIRYNIAVGMAKGLACLHSRGPQRLAHGDIKASNVLLDRFLEPKIADFGLARMCQNNERKVLTRIEGKRGYVAPEYARYGQLTAKTDVFSFGIIALELVSGRESMNPKFPPEEQYLLSWAWNLYEQRRVMDLVDPKVKEGCDEEQALLLIKVALLCSQGEGFSRPHMARVVTWLSGDADIPDIPQRPEFLGIGLTDPNKSRARGTALTTW